MADRGGSPEVRAGAQVIHEPGREYRPGVPVLIRARRRGGRVALDDLGGAVAGVDLRTAWHEAAARRAARDGMSVTRAGRIHLEANVSRDVGALAHRLAEVSAAVYRDLLAHEEAESNEARHGHHRRARGVRSRRRGDRRGR